MKIEKILNILFSDKRKKTALDILHNEIEFLHLIGSDKWAISLKAYEGLRIHFGPFIVFTLGKDNIWLSLDMELVNSNKKEIEEIKMWKWDEYDYPKYIKYGLKSKNGYLYSDDEEDWNLVRDYHNEFIRRIANKHYVLDHRTKRNHNNEVILYLSILIDKDFPVPEYTQNDEIKKMKYQELFVPEISLNVNYKEIEETEKQTMAKIRIGQRIFRDQLLKKHKACIICGLENNQLLKASHVKPWKDSSNQERLNIANGLLLCANHDLLFDSGLISFTDSGNLLLSKRISDTDLRILNLSRGHKITIDKGKEKYMEWHRKNKFKE